MSRTLEEEKVQLEILNHAVAQTHPRVDVIQKTLHLLPTS